ncbi:DUF58 domain-containing protein [Kouleothrix sp.]|uniref:DUF58 domain-containing protein n=1 Tax=Kouleothrix sp. TaxID=2779161 RepID=UPI00391D7801
MNYYEASVRHLARARRWLSLEGRLRPTQPWVFALGPAALLAGLIAPYAGLFVIAYSYMLLVLLMYLWVRELGPRVALHRKLLAEWAQVGDDLEELWDLENRARLPLLWLELEDASTLPGYNGRRVAGLGPGARQQWRTQAHCTRRGVYTLGPLTASLGDPFGLFRYQWREQAARQIVIYPPLVRLPPLLVPQGQRGGLARADLLQLHVTPSVGGLREYAPGDPPSRIHWPTVARTDKLMIKEFDQERAGALWIVLDLAAGAYPPAPARAPAPLHADPYAFTQTSVLDTPALESRADSLLELAIVLACSLASQALAEGRAVGLLADDGRRRMVMPGRGPRQLWRILGALVDAHSSGALPLGEVLRQGQAARATETAGAALALVTPALDGAWLPGLAGWQTRRAGGALALLVADVAAQAQPLAAQLAASGVPASIFELGAPLPLLTPPKPKTSARLSPLGKVIGG